MRDAEPAAGVRSLAAAFARSASLHGDRIALVADGEEVPYRQLDSWSAAVSELLRERGVRAGDRVAIRLSPGAEVIVAILAVLRAGCSYVPLDVRNADVRNEFILQDSGAAALIGTTDASVPAIAAEEITRLREAEPASPGPEIARPEDTAYIIYTSGTTGRPKGVPVRHSAVLSLLSATAGLFAFSADDRWLLFHSVAFDFSVWEIWGALSTGGRLVVLADGVARSPETCVAAIRHHAISVLNQTPTAFAALSAAADRTGTELPALRYVVFGGERLAPEALRPWAERHGLDRPALVNMYGITETTVHATHHVLTPGDIAGGESVIGPPLPGFAHRVLTPEGRDAGPDEHGVLWLAGPQVGEGYLNLPELTAERFRTMRGPDGEPRRYYRSGDVVSRRADGALRYHGREDRQVKIRGYRIELSDVESAVRSHELVVDAVVWVHEYDADDHRLVCAFTAKDPETPVPTRALRAHLSNLLPAYMRPAAYSLLADLPRTVNGKVDRAEVSRIWKERKDSST
ncbi:hypothetical protein GCM10010470_07540 [Saccharopolyspora taberi]|uniref:Amino acid adenylation domain-containing protein n=1 Tax=Saccharopolyspora taberi TaxID=60895 RepID=A0ABN3V3Q5_9PSEU